MTKLELLRKYFMDEEAMTNQEIEWIGLAMDEYARQQSIEFGNFIADQMLLKDNRQTKGKTDNEIYNLFLSQKNKEV